MTNFATSFLIFKKKGIIFHENRLSAADDSHEISCLILIVIVKKQQNLKLSSAANYRLRFMG